MGKLGRSDLRIKLLLREFYWGTGESGCVFTVFRINIPSPIQSTPENPTL